MSTELRMNNFKASWNHYRENVRHYRCDDGVVEFRYQDSDDCDSLNVIIQYIETDNNDQLHELLRHIIDTMTESRRSMPFGTIIFKGYANRYYELELNQFHYNNYHFIIKEADCVMITVDDLTTSRDY
jgi:hypothetical protein